MAYCQLGDMRWRVDPTNVNWSYQLDTSRIETLGGQVVQILGATLSDMTISGDFGQDHPGKQLSWQLAEGFHRKIQAMMDAQVSEPFSANSKGSGGYVWAEDTYVHNPYQLTYHDGVHDWSFKVLVKAIEDPMGGSLTHTVARPNYQYKLTLFIVQADSDLIRTIASDAFISRIAQGVGWRRNAYHGAVTAQDAQDFIVANGGSITGMFAKILGGQPVTYPPNVQPPENPVRIGKGGVRAE